MRVITRSTALLLAVVTFGCASAPVGDYEEVRRLERAREAYLELLDEPDQSVPQALLDEAVCVAVFPRVIKAALTWGGRHGLGVVSCRNQDDVWSPPAFYRIAGGSFGLQVGVESTDVVLFIMNRSGAQSWLQSEVTLGGKASVAAGPVGRSGEAATDLRLNAEIYSYARSRGLFAGISLEGAHLSAHQQAIERFYGKRIFPETILFEQHVPRLPDSAERFLGVLP